ncbi:MAG TPA: polymorphic toxin-type HINT domain-containing protein [Jatrophihabitantaceae bacterium]
MTPLIAVFLVVAVPVSSVDARGGLTANRHGKHKAQPAPKQRTGTAANRPHVIGAGGNDVVPTSLRGRYPLRPIAQPDLQGRNTARVVPAPSPGTATGFDAKTSQELPERRGQFEQTFANADGTQTTVFSPTPVNYRDRNGDWQPVQPKLVTTANGLSSSGGAASVQLARRSGAGQLGTLSLDAQHKIGWTLAGAGASTAQVHGDTANYTSIAKDADLEVASQAAGIEQTIVLRSPAARRSYTFQLALTGLTARLTGSQIDFADDEGKVRATMPAGSMRDSATSASTSSGVHYRLVQVAGRPALQVNLDAGWLDDPQRVYPVRVDPSVATPSASAAVTVRDNDAIMGDQDFQVGLKGSTHAAAYLAFPGVSTQLAHETIYGAQLSVVNYDSASCKARPVSVYPVTQAWTPSTSLRYPGPSVGAPLASQSFAYGYVAFGHSSTACAVAGTLFNLGTAGRDLVQGWVNGQANNGLSLRASATDPLGWKDFTGTSTVNPPKLYITHSPYNADYSIPNPVPNPPVLQNQNGQVKISVTNKGAETWTPASYYLAYRAYDANGHEVAQQRAGSLPGNLARGAKVTMSATIKAMPVGTYTLDFTMVHTGGPVFTDEQVPPARIVLRIIDVPANFTDVYPANGYQAPTLTPQLWASANDVDAVPGQSITYDFKICPASGACTESGYHAARGWVIPANTLSWNQTYSWTPYAKDGNGTITTGPTLTMLTAVPQPAITGHLSGAPYSSADKDFDPLVGNYSSAAIDASVATAGPTLNVARTYNSLDPRTDEAFGAGWSTVYDMKLVPETDGTGNVVVTFPDGQEVRFGKNPDGTYVPPSSRQAQLTTASGTWTLRDQGGSSYSFSGTGKLTKIQGPWGLPLVIGYGTDGKLAKVTSQNSNRSLTFAWTGTHVGSVSTDPINGSALTWNYTYSGDQLTKVCAPDSSCTTYDTTPGSHYRSVVLDSKPDSYLRLGDASGTDATSEVAVNLGKDTGTYSAATLGGTGALAGTSDTSASLNGTSSSVGLPPGAVKKSRDMAVELWFKTSGNGPLVGYQDHALASASTLGVPVLYVGSDGKLRGQLWTGTIAPITSAGTVNNGAWHHVVLSSMGATQTLFLDGTQVGTLSGTIDQSTLTYNQVGAAYASATTWPGYGTTQRRYFNGSVDEVALYSHPLSADVVAAHRRLGVTPSAELSKITLPSGSVGAEISYDPTADRVKEYIDGNGGTWKVGRPAVAGGDTDLRRTVLVRDPADRPYLYEYDALGGYLLRTGSPTGISTRPEDGPTPTSTPTPTTTPVCTTPDPGDPTFCTWDTGAGSPVSVDYDISGMSIRSYQYDDNGQLKRVVNENGDYVDTTYDARGNVTARTTCRTNSTDCYTTRYTFPTGLTDPLDPRWDKPLEMRDARSANATDNTYRTTFTYGTKGDLATQTSPDGGTVHNYLTNGSEVAVGGGAVPSGLPLQSTDARGAVTKFGYYSTGDLAQITDPSGLVTKFSYDALGRRISETEVSDTFPNGVTTSYAYDALSRLTTTTGPATTDAVTGIRHQSQTLQTYDPDGDVLASETKDLLGGDLARKVTNIYDDHDRLVTATDPDGNEIAYTYDVFGNKMSMVDANGDRYEYAYTARNVLAEVRLRDANSTGDGGYTVLSSTAYDFAGRVVQQTDAEGRTVVIGYFHDDLVATKTLKDFHNPDGSKRDYVLEQDTYDGAGNLTKQVAGNGTVTTTYTRDPMGRVKSTTFDPNHVNSTTSYTYDLDGNVTHVANSGNVSNVPWSSEVPTATTDYVYDLAGRQTSETVALGNSATAVTTTSYDQRGNPTAVVSPRGNVSGADKAAYTSSYAYDELGRTTVVTVPPIVTEHDGQAPVTQRSQTTTGYDTFGETTSVKDPLGNVASTTYDQRGLPVRSQAPAYTPPGSSTPITPVTTSEFDGVGNLTSSVDALGNTSKYTYDRLGRLLAKDEPSSSDSDRAVTRYTYTLTGKLLSTTDPSGAVTQQTYDDLDRPITSTDVERKPQADNFTTTAGYDDAGNAVTSTSPTGAKTTAGYDSAGQLTSLTDPNGVVTRYGYDGLGNQVRISDGLGRTSRTNYDVGGRVTSEADLNASNAPIRTQSYTYDTEGNALTSTPPNGHATSYTYNAVGELTQQVEPADDTTNITTSFGYDARGDRSRYTDGRGNSTIYTSNSLGLPESVIEPSTPAQPGAADRTWTASYNAAGEPVTLQEPGGVQRQRTYDASGRLTGESGTGGESSTAVRSIGYNSVGEVTSLGTPTGNDSFSYNDRGALLSASGPSGSASFNYDGDGALTQRTDASGTATFGYTKGRLSSETDSVTGAQQTFGYDAAGAVKSISYGSGITRGFSYDALGRVSADTLANSSGSAVASVSYGYDLDNNVTSKDTTGVAGAGHNAYSYDYLDRLTSWTAPDGTATAYAWDASSNRIKAGGKTSTFDARNRLVSDGTFDYSYSARGTLLSKTSGSDTQTFTFDAFDRMTGGGNTSYTYDSNDRLASTGDHATSYAGLGADLVSDGNETFGRGAGGELQSVADGANKRQLLTDQHGDVIGGFDPTDSGLSALPDSQTYDPWGKVTASGGAKYDVGFQGDLTDNSTGQVDMGARWYDPGTGTFDSQDTVQYDSGASSLANEYVYGAGNPVTNDDPTGNWPHCGICHKVAHAVTHAVSTGWNAATSAVNTAWDWSVSAAKHAASWMADTVSDAWDFAKSAYHAAARFVSSVVHTVAKGVSWVYDKAKTAVTNVWHAAVNTYNWVSDKVSQGVNWAKQKAAEAAQAAHAAAVRVTNTAKAAIHYAATHNPIPALVAAVKPLYEGVKKVVSSVAKLPAAVVKVAVNVVKDAKAAVQAVYQAAVTAAGSVVHAVSTAVSAVSEFAADHWKTIASIAAGIAVGLGCTLASGATAVAACVIAGSAVVGALSSALNCPPGKSIAACAVRGGIAGGVGGAVAVATGGLGEGFVVAALASGTSAAGEDATQQYLSTGHVDINEVATSGLTGAATGAAASRLHLGGDESAGAGGCKCFAAGTDVATASGEKPIEKIKVGDKVWAQDLATGKRSLRKVTGLFKKVAAAMMTIIVAGSAVVVTTEHPFYTPDRGWVESSELKVGDKLTERDGHAAVIQKITYSNKPTVVYNFSVEGDHNYYVGESGLLVHNCNVNVPDEHVVVRGGTTELPPPGEVFSGSHGSVLDDAAAGVPHGQIRATTAGEIRRNGGEVAYAPEYNERVGRTNYQHVNVQLGSQGQPFGDLMPNPVPKARRFGGTEYPYAD